MEVWFIVAFVCHFGYLCGCLLCLVLFGAVFCFSLIVLLLLRFVAFDIVVL